MPFVTTVNRWSRRALWRAGLGSDGMSRAVNAIHQALADHGDQVFAESGVPGVSLAVQFASGPLITWQRGFADFATRTPMDEHTVFQACSMTKPLTAILVMTLVDRGLIDLDAPIWSPLRSWSLPANRCGSFDPAVVTVRRVLSHSSGLSIPLLGWNPPGVATPILNVLNAEHTPESTLRLEAPHGPMHYSGGGYALLQILVEDATGLPFAEAARRYVLDPLRMTSSDVQAGPSTPPRIDARLATRHGPHNEPIPRATFISPAASGLYASAPDLARLWTSMLAEPFADSTLTPILSRASRAEMLKIHSGREANRTCGLGFFVYEKRSDLVYMHAGFAQGWWGHAEGLARRRAVYILLTNGDKGHAIKPLISYVRQALYDHAL